MWRLSCGAVFLTSLGNQDKYSLMTSLITNKIKQNMLQDTHHFKLVKVFLKARAYKNPYIRTDRYPAINVLEFCIPGERYFSAKYLCDLSDNIIADELELIFYLFSFHLGPVFSIIVVDFSRTRKISERSWKCRKNLEFLLLMVFDLIRCWVHLI